MILLPFCGSFYSTGLPGDLTPFNRLYTYSTDDSISVMVCQVYNYLVVSKAITPDGAEMGAMKSLKAVKYFKEEYVQDLKMNTQHSYYVYIQSQMQASMKRILYRVEICIQKLTVDIVAARCNCP